MIRFLYFGLIRLHPRQFRLRHGEEMLSAFEHAARDGSEGRLRLLGDGVISLIRQWTLRPATQTAVAQPAEGGPMFRAIKGGMPGRTALAYGCILALASFSVLALAALRGAGRLPSWRLFEAVRGQVYAPQRTEPAAASSTVAGTGSAVAGSPAGRQSAARGAASAGRVVYLDPLLAAFDLNHDGYLSQHELDYAPVVLSGLDWDHDGQLTLDEIQ